MEADSKGTNESKGMGTPKNAEDAPQFTYRHYDPENVASPFGLNNNGAICWFNSTIQLLLGLASLNEVMMEKKEELEHNKLASAYNVLLEALLPNNPEYESITPAHFAGASMNLLRAMLQETGTSNSLGMGQQCAAEGFSTFIQTLNYGPIDDLLCNAYVQIIKCKRCDKEVSSTKDTSNRINIPPTKNFASAEEQRAWREYAAGLPADHPHRHVIANFKTADEFQAYICNHAVIALDFTCPNCNYKMPLVARGERLTLLREIIIVSFDMFGRMDPTWYPQELKFRSLDGTTLYYRMCGKVCWSGSINRLPDGRIASGGHYWAHSFRDGKWFCFNDNSVTPGNPNPCANTFMIAYHLMENK